MLGAWLLRGEGRVTTTRPGCAELSSCRLRALALPLLRPACTAPTTPLSPPLASPFLPTSSPASPSLPADAWLDGVEQSLLYCTDHAMDQATGQAVFERRVPVRVKNKAGEVRPGAGRGDGGAGEAVGGEEGAHRRPRPACAAVSAAASPCALPPAPCEALSNRLPPSASPSTPQVRREERLRPYALVREDLRAAALLRYAAQFRHLESSRNLLKEARAGGLCFCCVLWVCGGWRGS